MRNPSGHVARAAALSIVTILLTTVAWAEPQVFAQMGLVRNLTTTSDAPCTGDGGGAGEFSHWNLVPDKTKLKVDRQSNNRHRLDVQWRWPHELQDPDFHVVNDGETPIPADICQPTFEAVEKHVFMFAIHDLKNPPSEAEHEHKRKSPHALIYVPMHTISGGYPYTGDQFYLFVFDIKEEESDCSKEPVGYPQDRCLALHRLLVKNKEFLAKVIHEDHLIAAIEAEIVTILPTSIWSFKDQRTRASGPFAVLLHNGIIHGTLGGG